MVILINFLNDRREQYKNHMILKSWDKLPDYMLPRKQIKLQEMPRNAHGKIDRAALKGGIQ